MKLTLFLNDNEIQSLILDPSQDYTVGRGDDCEIKLQGERGISRKHIRLYFNGTHWMVELLSKFGGLIYHHESAESIELDPGVEFSIPPYKFICEATTTGPIEVEAPSSPLGEAIEPINRNNPSFEPVSSSSHSADSSEVVASLFDEVEDSPDQEAYEGGLESTSPGYSQLATLLIAHYPTGDEEIFKLEGNSWVAGRDPDCEIFLRNDHVSRRHFELNQTEQGLQIIDLGSSNGTFLNEKPLQPNQAYNLESGDQIRVKKLRLTLQIKDLEFHERLSHIPQSQLLAPIHSPYLQDQVAPGPVAPSPPQAMVPTENYLAQYLGLDENPMGVVKEASPLPTSKMQIWHQHKIKIITGLLIPVIIIGLFMDEKPKKETIDLGAKNKEMTPYEKLSQQERELIKDSLRLAKSYLHGAKYSLCLSEIQKIHKHVPFYERSVSIEKTCRAGLEIEDKQRAEQEKLEKQAQTEQKIRGVIDNCKAKFNNFETLEELNQCLAAAIELNPGSLEVEQLQATLSDKIQRQQQLVTQRAERARLIAMGEREFQKAMKTLDEGHLLNSIKELNEYLKTSYPDPKQNRQKAERALASIKKKLEIKVGVLLDDCKKSLSKEQYKEAFDKCELAKKEDPTNSQVSLLQKDIRHQLSKKMKILYDNASIEENYGNIEAAKEIWKKIISEDFKDGSEFYSRSIRKLKKYGLD